MTAPYDARQRATRPDLVAVFIDAPPPETYDDMEDGDGSTQEQP